MPRKLPPYVERNHVKGHTYLSFRRDKGPRIRLPDDPTSEEFATAYRAALSGETQQARPVIERDKPGTINALITSYKKSAPYLSLRSSSKVGYNRRLEAIREAHGHRTLSGMNHQNINKFILQPYADRPGAALDTLKKLRILIRHAIGIGLLNHDPSIGIKRAKTKRIRSWTDAEIATFRGRWTLGTKQRLAFELFLGTGQRRSDVVKMAWPHIDGGKITIVQQKTERRLVIPLHQDLVEALGHAQRNNVSILTTAYGKPFTVDGFSQWMRDAITAAGLPLECQPHGLRKATGRSLAEAGASAKEIMAILGHTTLAEAERYTEDADQIGLAAGAVSKLEGHKANKNAQTKSTGLGKAAKNQRKSI